MRTFNSYVTSLVGGFFVLIGVSILMIQFYYDTDTHRIQWIDDLFGMESGFGRRFINLLFGGGVSWAGVYLSKYGERLRAKSAHKIMIEDNREPILLLRSFDADGAGVDCGGSFLSQSLMAFLSGVLPGESFEEKLTKFLSTMGPVICLGKPGESAPQLGAARMYFKRSNWQEEISLLFSSSKLIIVIAGVSDGLRWELQWLRENALLDKLVILFPPDDLLFLLNKDAINSELVLTLPVLRDILNKDRQIQSQQPILLDLRCGTPRLKLSKRFQWQDYEKALQGL